MWLFEWLERQERRLRRFKLGPKKIDETPTVAAGDRYHCFFCLQNAFLDGYLLCFRQNRRVACVDNMGSHPSLPSHDGQGWGVQLAEIAVAPDIRYCFSIFSIIEFFHLRAPSSFHRRKSPQRTLLKTKPSRTIVDLLSQSPCFSFGFEQAENIIDLDCSHAKRALLVNFFNFPSNHLWLLS